MQSHDSLPEQAMDPHPMIADADPIVTANIYCSRRLDDLMKAAIVPFWSQVSAEFEDAGCRLWLMRYAKRGEHLKVRIHAPEALKDRLVTALKACVESYFQSTAGSSGEWLSNPAVPPIDIEDQSPEDQEDRSFLLTTYRRSPVCFGEPTFCADDRHVALFCRAMAAQAELLLSRLAPHADDSTFGQRRQNLLIQQVIAALAAVGFDDGKITDYVKYHRGWLTRSLVSKGDARSTTEESVAGFYSGKLDRMGPAIEGLTRLLAARHQAQESRDPLMDRWRDAVSDLFGHVEAYRGDPRYDFDPYTDDHAFLPIYKVLHLGANQLGLRISGEAFVYYLLAAACGVDDQDSSDTPGAAVYGGVSSR